MSDEKRETGNNNITYYNETKSGVDDLDKPVRTNTVVNVRHRDRLSRSFWTCWTLLHPRQLVLWITANPNWQQGKPHRRRLFLHELATQLLHDHASTRFRTPHGKRRRIQKCTRRFRNHHCSDWPVLVTGWCDWQRRWETTSTMPHVPEKERAEDDNRIHLAFVQRNNNNNATVQHMSNAVLQAALTAVLRRRVLHAPRVETNARVISEWAGAERDYCRGRKDCSDALTWNTIISVSQIKSIFAPIAVFSLYNIYMSIQRTV